MASVACPSWSRVAAAASASTSTAQPAQSIALSRPQAVRTLFGPGAFKRQAHVPHLFCRQSTSRPSVGPGPFIVQAVSSSSSGNEGLISRILRRASGSLPIVGLVNRLLTPGGGIGSDYVDYQAFARGMYDKHGSGMMMLFEELEEAYTLRYTDSRVILFCLWLAVAGAGVIDREEMAKGARRLRISKDLGFEVESFDAELEEAFNKETTKKRVANLPDMKRVELALQLLNQCVAGGDIGKTPQTFINLMSCVFPSVELAEIEEAVQRYLPEEEKKEDQEESREQSASQ